jgi:putative membrane protein
MMNRKQVAAVGLLVLIPVLITGAFLWAGWNSNERLRDSVQAAIVNLDEPVTLQGQYTPLGRQLTAALVDSNRDENLNWTLTKLEDAQAGLASGKYVAMVVIPKEFSANATSFAGDAADAAQATITIDTSPVAGIADAEIGRHVSLAAATMLNDTLTKGYLDQIYLGFNTMKDQYQELADGSRQLADGSVELTDGIKELNGGAGELADGADQLADGLSEIPKVVDGAGQLATGGRKLADGLELMAKEVKPLPEGAKQLADGQQQLADGLKQMDDEVKKLPAATEKLADGMAQAADGADTYADGVKQYTSGVTQLLDQVLPLTTFLDDIEPLADDAEKAANLLNKEVKSFHSQMKDIKDDDAIVADAVKAARDAAAKAPCPSSIAAAGLCDDYTEALKDAAGEAAKQGVVQAGKEIAKQMEQTNSDGRSVLSTVQEIADEAKKLPAEAKKLTAELNTYVAGMKQLREAGPQLADGADELVDGLDQLADGTKQLSDGMPALSKGVTTSAKGAAQLADGMKELSDGLPALSKGVSDTAAGAGKLADGLETFATELKPLNQVVDGSRELADGTYQLADGVGQLSEGADKLADGMTQMADGIDEGKDEIPNYSESDREQLTASVSGPISTDGMDKLANANLGWGSVLLVLSLWLGALACNTVLRANRQRMLTSNASTPALIWRHLRPGVAIMGVQTVIVVAITQTALQLPPAEFFTMAALMLLAGVAFYLLNYALANWLGNWGRLVSLVAAALFTTAGLTAALPQIVTTIRSALPLTPALEGMRSIATGAAGLPNCFVTLAGLTAVAGLASAVFIVRSRATTLEALVEAP